VQEYGADGIIGLEFRVDDVKRADIEVTGLQWVAVTGLLSSSRTLGDRLAQKVGRQPPPKISSKGK
jgi:hypothetical protein